MSEDYKKIAFEDVKVGQKVRIVERRSAFTVTYEGAVFRTNPEWDRIDLGEEGDEVTIIVDPEPEPGTDFDIFLLEDAPKPKVVRTETVTITHYDDGTKTETPVKDWWVPARIETMDQFEFYEDYLNAGEGAVGVVIPTIIETMENFKFYEGYLKTVILKDRTGRYWENRHGVWGLTALDGTWHFSNKMYVAADNLPMTVVDNVGD